MAASSCCWRASSRAACSSCGTGSPRAGGHPSRSRPAMLLEARAVTQLFGSFRAVSEADLDVQEGDIIGLIGPNGAGKSTFFNCLSGDLAPTAGSVRFDGEDVTRASPETHARLGIGRTFQIPATFPDMTILDNVMVGAFLRHPHRKDARDAALEAIEFAGLKSVSHQRARSLGTPGRRQRSAGDRGLYRASAPAAAAMTLRLEVEHLEVRYGDLIGVADVSLRVEEGHIVALLGSNGAGKTTTLNAIAGLVRPSAGTIRWRGEEIGGMPAYAIVPKGLALSPEGWRLFVNQTVEQNLRLGATALRDKSRVPRLLDRVFGIFPRLAERRRQSASTLSGGERQMLALGRALMSEPKLLLLDEPSLGLAPAVLETLYDTLWKLHQEGLTLLLAEQTVPLALDIADYGYVLQTGRTVLEGTARELEADKQVQKIYLGIKDEPASAILSGSKP